MFVPDRLQWLFEFIPMWFRSHGPLKVFFWQEDEIKASEERAKEIAKALGWKYK